MKQMRISFTDGWVETRPWETMDEMFSFLVQQGHDYLWLGEDVEHPVEFYTITATQRSAATNPLVIAISSEGHGLVPSLLPNPRSGMLIIGLNREVVGIDPREHRILFRLECDWLFYQFLWLIERRIILAFHEIGVVAITDDGEELWRYSKDIVVDWMIDNDRLHLKFMSVTPVDLHILTGSLWS